MSAVAIGGAALIGTSMAAAAAMVARAEFKARAHRKARLALIRSARAPAPSESLFARIGRALAASPIVGGGEVAKLRQNLYAAGFVGPDAVQRFVGVKLAAAAFLVMLGLAFVGGDALTTLAVILGLVVAGLRGPDMVIASRAKSRREKMDRGLPDALDLLVVCGEAGIGIDVALERVAIEMREVHPELAHELGVTVSEMRLIPDRLQALRAMGERVQLDSVKGVASTLIQTVRYGTPLGKALRMLTADIRLERTTKMESAAARLPVLITVPMIVFILPATTLVVAGPAFLQLIDALSGLGG